MSCNCYRGKCLFLKGKEDGCKGCPIKKAYNNGVRDTKKDHRQQGEWIECTKSGMPLTEYGRMTGEKWYGFKCSRCKYIYKGNALIESPYCQKCGADMRKGGAEE